MAYCDKHQSELVKFSVEPFDLSFYCDVSHLPPSALLAMPTPTQSQTVPASPAHSQAPTPTAASASAAASPSHAHAHSHATASSQSGAYVVDRDGPTPPKRGYSVCKSCAKRRGSADLHAISLPMQINMELEWFAGVRTLGDLRAVLYSPVHPVAELFRRTFLFLFCV